MGRWVRKQWLRAQGFSWRVVFEGAWKERPCCVVCDRQWRPDQNRFVPVYGTSYGEPTLYHHFWHSEELGITKTYEGSAESVRHLCREHNDKWSWVSDCVTGERVQMLPPLLPAERAFRDLSYWTGTVLRFIFLIGQWAYLWIAYKVAGYAPLYIPGPWPPLREAE